MLVNVGKMIVSKYVAESINNWLQDVLVMKSFISYVQNWKLDGVRPKARTTYKLKNCRVRLDRYSNQICF